ncbi:MAG TPA: NAD(+) synthase [Verrucomicrobiae bacterium]|jgi:NAD+ synthase (glutamine-hydrolysing)|nr:NAD(+) synthase [Verrucomicrobiae bacterium]
MKLIKVGVAALNQTALDWKGNRRRIGLAIDQARAAGVSLLCLPEMCVSGYGCEDAFHAANTTRMAWKSLQELLPATRGMVVTLGLPMLFQNGLFNCVCLAVDGRIAGFAAKRFLAGDGIHYEPRWFKPWPTGLRAKVEAGGAEYPIGDFCFDCGGVRIGFEICEDAWVANRPGAALALEGVDVILNPSATHFAFGKKEIRERLALEGSRAFGVTYLLANLLGNEAGRAIYDGGGLIASGGKLLAGGARFSFQETTLTTAVVDVEATRMNQARTGSFQPSLAAGEEPFVRTPFVWPDAAWGAAEQNTPAWESGPFVKEEEFCRAEALALFDYMRKSRSFGFVVSLSGGADSAAITCLIHIMAALGLQELGPEEWARRLSYIPGFTPCADTRAVVSRLLTTVYQSADNSGPVTRAAARAIAEAAGAQHYEWNVGATVRDYIATVQKATGSELNWEEHDLALQNIQARARSPGVWLVANLKNALLLATSNRSEAAVGYATMDGDTSGGLSPLAGIDKAWLRRWLRWVEKTGPSGVGPMPALAAINEQAPTAELRPPGRKQTDEDDLMPYDVLDVIERTAIRDRRSPVEVFEIVRLQFPERGAANLGLWIERFFRLWCRNQWKRERYAPSFHLDDENLDPKTWCRFPILSGGYEEELEELRARVKNLAK